MSRTSLFIVLCAVGMASPVAGLAQVCGGTASFANGRMQVAAAAQTGNQVAGYGAVLGLGAARGAFGSMSVARVKFDLADTAKSSGTGFGVAAGYARNLSEASATTSLVQLCPVIGIDYMMGPDLSAESLIGWRETRSWVVRGGFQLGAAFASSPSLTMVPSVGLTFVHQSITMKSDNPGVFPPRVKASEVYAVIEVASGLVMKQRLTVRPSVAFPVGLDEVEPTIGLAMQINVGRP